MFYVGRYLLLRRDAISYFAMFIFKELEWLVTIGFSKNFHNGEKNFKARFILSQNLLLGKIAYT